MRYRRMLIREDAADGCEVYAPEPERLSELDREQYGTTWLCERCNHCNPETEYRCQECGCPNPERVW